MYRILYVDDEPGLLEIGKLFLEQSGQFSVDIITSAPDALTLLNSKKFDAIISDYQMPEMDGIAFLKAIRERYHDIPFILFTGRGREEVVIEAINNGVDFYLQKGGDPKSQFAELAHKIRQAVARRQAERLLVESEKRLSDIINFLPDATFAIDTSGRVIAWNRAIEEMTGIPANRILGKGDYEYAIPLYGERRPILIDLIFSPPDDIKNHYSNIVRDGTILAAETMLPRLQGEPRTLWGKASLLYDQAGTVIGAIESIRDITERKAVEVELVKAHDVLEDQVKQRTADLYVANLQLQKEIEIRTQIDSALRESEERFRTLIEKAPDAILLFDVDLDQYIEANERAEQLFGCNRQQLLDFGPQQFYLPDQVDGRPFRETVLEHRKQVLAGAELVFERRVRNANGEDRIAEVRLVHLPSPNRKLIRSSFIDITERKRVEAAFKESEERYRAIVEQDFQSILENIQDVFYRTNLKGNLILVSPYGAKLLGYAGTDEMIGRPATDYYTDPAQWEIFLAGLKKDRSVSNMEITLKRKNGSPVTVSTSSHIYKDASGNYAGVEGIFRDITERKRVEDNLRDSEQRYRNVVEDQTEFISRFLPNGTHVFVNEAYCRYYDLKRDEILGHRFRPRIPVEDQERVKQFFASLMPDHPVDIIEHRIIMPDSAIRWQRWTDRAIFDSSEKVTEYQSVGRDITEEQATKVALQESEKRFRELADLLPQIVYETDTDGNLKYANNTAFERFGYTADDFKQGLTIWQMLAPDDLERVSADFRTLIEGLGGTEHSGEYMALRKDGSTFPVTVYSSPTIVNGRITGLRGIIVDITEQKNTENELRSAYEQITADEEELRDQYGVLQKSEKALRASEAMYRTILNNTGSATIIIEEDMTISFANPEVERIMGYSKEEIEGKRSWTEFVFPDDVEQMNRYHQLRRTNPDKAPPNYEFRVITKDRQIRNAYITIGLIPGTTKAIASFVDITENKHAEEALRQANKKLNLLSDITRHDINNQLMELRSYLAILEMKQPNPALIEYLQKAVTVAQKISTTIQFTKEYESIGVKSPVWQDCRTLIETAAKQSILGNVVVKNNLTAGAEVFADPLIVKVFYNLMENAVRYGGKVTTIRFSVEERNHDHVLVCEDDGNGVPTDEKKQIFERGVGKNTGLGLFLSREILSITGITLSETGEPGKGARFEILVPKGVYRFAEELKPS